MSTANALTFTVAANTGYVISLAQPALSVQLTSRCNLWVQFASSGAAPTAPVATPAAAAGGSCPYTYLKVDETMILGTESFSEVNPPPSKIKYLSIWAETDGYLSVQATQVAL